mgnify:CR=1 FL=1
MTIKIGWIGCGRHATWMLMPQLAQRLKIEAEALNLLHTRALSWVEELSL